MSAVCVSVIVRVEAIDEHLTGCLDSLAAQTLTGDLFEVITVGAGLPDALVDRWRADRPDVALRSHRAATSGAGLNAALDLAEGSYLTFVDGRDRVAPRMLATLVDRARPDTITVAATGRISELDGLPDFDVASAADLMLFVGRPARQAELAVTLCGAQDSAGGKLVPSTLARTVRFRDDLTTRTELVFWVEALAAGAVIRLASLSADAAYLQRPVAVSSEPVESVAATIATLQALGLSVPAALRARDVAVDRLIAERVRPRLTERPDELRHVRAALRAAGVSDKRAPLERHAAEEIVFLGTAPALDQDGALLATRLGGRAIDLALYQPDGATLGVQALRAPAADVADELLTAYGPLQPTWAEIGAHLARQASELAHQEDVKGRPYRHIRSLGASPIEHLSAALARIARPTTPWTAEFALTAEAAELCGADTILEADEWFQVVGAGLLEAGYPLDEVPEQLPLFAEMVTLGLADHLVFDTREQAERMLARCPVPEIVAHAREVMAVCEEVPAGSAQPEMIKLVVWDLDETFWRGTLAEDGEVWIPEESIHALKELNGRGIVSSICSKNHHDAARDVLQRHGLWDQFVFPRIAFTPKGEAVRRLVADMGLRAVNVLFVDDNATNLAEVAFYNPGIQVLDAGELSGLLDLPGAVGKPDPEHTRLGHYRLLEQRHSAQELASSNDEFLRSSGLRIELAPAGPADAERIHEMVMRTNQLNFTKKRITRAEVDELLADPSGRSTTVRVQDDFGDYGVVGWFYLRAGELEHFLFSCRTINLGIEQHVYAYLGHPRLEVAGETAGEVGPDDVVRDYISLEEIDAPREAGTPASATALLPGEDRLGVFVLSACDLFQAVGRLALPMVDLTFECNTFRGPQRGVNTGTDYLRSCFEMSTESKAFARENLLNYQGSTAFATQIFEQPYDYVVLGIHDDLTYGQLRHRTRRDLVVQADLELRRILGALPEPVTFGRLVDGHEVPGETEPGMSWLAEEFEDEGLITPERFRENLAWILERLHPGTQLLVATAPELAFFREGAEDLAFLRERAVLLNRVVREFCAAEPRAHVVEMNDVVHDRAHVTNYVMHLTAERGHALAQLILDQMAAHPSERLDRRTRLGIGERPITLWDVNPERSRLVAKVLTAAGMSPQRSVDLRHPFDPSEATYVLAVSDERDQRIETALGQHGYRPHEDYLVARPWVFSPDWQEAGA